VAVNSQNSFDTPVVLLFFNRPDTTAAVMETIRAAQPSVLYLVQDGPRPHVAGERELVDQARRVAQAVDWECAVTTVYSDTNMGLRNRVTSGLDRVFSEVERAIILEDDCVADSSFFPFAQHMLTKYADDPRVGTVSGNNFLRGRRVSDDSYFFTPDVRIWGWATWARVWKDFSAEGLTHDWTRAEAAEVVKNFPSPTRRRALIAMAEKAHTINSWALPFVLHCQKRSYLSIVPEVNLVTNIGFGAGSTHTRFESFTDDLPAGQIGFPLRHPEKVSINQRAGALETSLHRRLWVTYPLRHPLDTLGRVVRYLRG
jgi:hypothetical protein